MLIGQKDISGFGMVQSERKVFITLILVSCIFVGKFIGAFVTDSLALFSDSWHLLTDIASLIISWWGLKQARKSATYQYTFGFYRHGVLTALINNVSLIVISVFIFCKAIDRYLHPTHVDPGGMILLAIFGLILNSIIILGLRADTKNINVKSVFIHFLGDALSDCGVLLGGIIIFYTGLNGVDTLLSAILACLILGNALKMTMECIKILLEKAPSNISVEELIESLKQINGVVSVTDLHIWSLSMENIAMTAHVCFESAQVSDCEAVLHRMQDLLREKYGIDHSTIQFEHSTCSSCYHSKPNHCKHCSMCIDSCSDLQNENQL